MASAAVLGLDDIISLIWLTWNTMLINFYHGPLEYMSSCLKWGEIAKIRVSLRKCHNSKNQTWTVYISIAS